MEFVFANFQYCFSQTHCKDPNTSFIWTDHFHLFIFICSQGARIYHFKKWLYKKSPYSGFPKIYNNVPCSLNQVCDTRSIANNTYLYNMSKWSTTNLSWNKIKRQEKFEVTKVVIRSRTSKKDNQYNGQKTKLDEQWSRKYYTENRATRITLNTALNTGVPER